MNSAVDRGLSLVGSVSDLEQYPIDKSERLDAHFFVKWWHHRWLHSRTFKLASWEAQGMARALFDYCQSESPIGTLPADDAELAYMLRIDTRKLVELRGQEFGPLRGWRRCLCGDEIRLMHPVVLEQVQDVLERRETRGLSKEAAAERQRLKRLREQLAEKGIVAAALDDLVLMRRMDAWLIENWKRRRDAAAADAVLLHAARAGWFDGAVSQSVTNCHV